MNISGPDPFRGFIKSVKPEEKPLSISQSALRANQLG